MVRILIFKLVLINKYYEPFYYYLMFLTEEINENSYIINSISCWIILNLHEFTLQAILLYFVVYKIYAKLYFFKKETKNMLV